jgi:hypothetical protein
MSEKENGLVYSEDDHDMLIKHDTELVELNKKVEDLTVLKENVIQLTALEKHLVDDSTLRTEQYDAMAKDNSKQ